MTYIFVLSWIKRLILHAGIIVVKGNELYGMDKGRLEAFSNKI